MVTVKLKEGVSSINFRGQVFDNSSLTKEAYDIIIKESPELSEKFDVQETEEE